MNLIVVGPGAFGVKHLEGLGKIEGADVLALVGTNEARTREVAGKHRIPDVFTDLDAALALDDAEAVIAGGS